MLLTTDHPHINPGEHPTFDISWEDAEYVHMGQGDGNRYNHVEGAFEQRMVCRTSFNTTYKR